MSNIFYRGPRLKKVGNRCIRRTMHCITIHFDYPNTPGWFHRVQIIEVALDFVS